MSVELLKGIGYGVAGATVAIVAAEIKRDYALGDKVKDFYLYLKSKVLGLFGKAKAAEQAAAKKF